MGTELLKTTVYISLLAQATIGAVDYLGLTYKVDPQHQILKDALKLETLVQTVEFIFYIWVLGRLNLETMAVDRYKDWFLTTPVMLFTTLLYMVYRANPYKIITFKEFVNNNKVEIVTIVLGNLSMLFFGLMGELGYMSLLSATFWGFLGYAFTFAFIYHNYAKFSKEGTRLFWFFAIVWSIYGLVYLLPALPKNIAYNFLDIIAKNFYGLYLFIILHRLKK